MLYKWLINKKMRPISVYWPHPLTPYPVKLNKQWLTNRCLGRERRADSRQHRDDHLDDLAPQALLFLIHTL